MKLASLKRGGRDGSLIVVSRDLSTAVAANTIAPTLRDAIENWPAVEPALRELAAKLEAGDAVHAFALDPATLAAPLPRTFQWADGSAYLHHAELVRKARNADMPSLLYEEPLLYQGASDSFIGARDDILLPREEWGLDLEAEIAVVTGDVPLGCTPAEAAGHIRLVMLLNDVSLRNLMPSELSKGFGFFVSKPSTAFAPVAVTPDELGDAWDGTKLSLPVASHVNGKLLGRPNAGVDMYFDFSRLIAFAATSRELRAGTIIGSGTVSNRDHSAGSSCLQEKRMLEQIEHGAITTPFLRAGDTVHIDVTDASGQSVFGAIDQRVVAP
ncbi:fumarylacetoacetate hydrolase family protein [Paraburkholderia sp. D15]|uniref:fumarylacetoacetate hydrolase family protein n=1 Tax=Paraburkholderia sp. D15 TaxID=2880218 RepID=UPI00247976FC|nr:fumarylacetoacetate hydrolase family protein [Paraburkholderia sp. D15]WGS50742.1 fumarylacetoacetate hydrolase family protein [Paraburkholderia sp. D15]